MELMIQVLMILLKIETIVSINNLNNIKIIIYNTILITDFEKENNFRIKYVKDHL